MHEGIVVIDTNYGLEEKASKTSEERGVEVRQYTWFENRKKIIKVKIDDVKFTLKM